jgi:hypothetical protein
MEPYPTLMQKEGTVAIVQYLRDNCPGMQLPFLMQKSANHLLKENGLHWTKMITKTLILSCAIIRYVTNMPRHNHTRIHPRGS